MVESLSKDTLGSEEGVIELASPVPDWDKVLGGLSPDGSDIVCQTRRLEKAGGGREKRGDLGDGGGDLFPQR